jgi:hypothetical protein
MPLVAAVAAAMGPTLFALFTTLLMPPCGPLVRADDSAIMKASPAK